MGETTIPCTEATRDRLREDKTPGVTWDRYLVDLLADAKLATEASTDVEDLDSLASAVETIERRTGRIERTLEELEGRR